MSFRLNPINLNEDGSLANAQMSFFSGFNALSERYKRDLQKGWAGQFRTLIMPYIDEEPYRVLYSTEPSRSNTPVNVLLGAIILKFMKGIPNDDDLREKICFDMEYRYALCCETTGKAPVSDNGFTRFRQACILHYINTGEDLIHKTFLSLKDRFAKLMEIDQSLFSMDSTMIDMWARDMNRLEILYTNNELMIQSITGITIHKCAPKTTTVKHSIDIIEGQLSIADSTDVSDGTEALRDFETERSLGIGAAKKALPARLHRYLDTEAKNITTYHSDEPYNDRITVVIADADTLIALCSEHPEYQEYPYYGTFMRILDEQCKKDGDGTHMPKGKGDGMDSGMVQNPHDTDATYREKDGEGHRGYVTGFTQAKNADGETLVMDYNVEKNNVSDQELGAGLLKGMRTDGNNDKITCVGDSLFNSDEMQRIAHDGNIEIVNTNLTGKAPADHCADHKFDSDGGLIECAGGASPVDTRINKDGTCTAKIDKSDCARCPHNNECGRKEQAKYNSLRTSVKTKERAEYLRSRDTDDFRAFSHFRNGIETVPSILKNVYNANSERGMCLAAKKLAIGLMYIAANASKVLNFASRRMSPALN